MKLDYVLSFTQAPVERDCYMNITKGIEVQIDIKWVIEEKKNIYN